MLGAPEQMVREDLDDPYVQAAANFAVLGINNLSKGKKVRVLVDVVEGTTQVSIIISLVCSSQLRICTILVQWSEVIQQLDDIPTMELICHP